MEAVRGKSAKHPSDQFSTSEKDCFLCCVDDLKTGEKKRICVGCNTHLAHN